MMDGVASQDDRSIPGEACACHPHTRTASGVGLERAQRVLGLGRDRTGGPQTTGTHIF